VRRLYSKSLCVPVSALFTLLYLLLVQSVTLEPRYGQVVDGLPFSFLYNTSCLMFVVCKALSPFVGYRHDFCFSMVQGYRKIPGDKCAGGFEPKHQIKLVAKSCAKVGRSAMHGYVSVVEKLNLGADGGVQSLSAHPPLLCSDGIQTARMWFATKHSKFHRLLLRSRAASATVSIQ